MQNFRPDIISGRLENNPQEIRRKVKEGVPFKELPAIRVLQYYVRYWVAYILENLKQQGKIEFDSKLKNVSYNLALRIYEYINITGFYNMLTQQPGFKEKRIDDVEGIKGELQDIRKKRAEIASYITNWASQNNRNDVFIDHGNPFFYIVHGRKDKTDYRIYLSPSFDSVYDVFKDLFDTIPHNIGYHMKAVDMEGLKDEAASLFLSRLDKIVIYCSEKNFDRVWQAVYEVFRKHRTAFENRPSPAGGIIAPLPGISIANQPERKTTATQYIDNVLRIKIKEQAEKEVRQNIESQNFKTLEDVRNKKPGWLSLLVKFVDEDLESSIDCPWGLYLVQFTDKQKGEVRKILRREILRELINALLEKRKWSADNIRTMFLKRLQEARSKNVLDNSIVQHLQKTAITLDNSLIEPIWTQFCLAAYFYTYLTSSARKAFHDYQTDQDIVEAVSQSFYGLLPNEIFKIERIRNKP